MPSEITPAVVNELSREKRKFIFIKNRSSGHQAIDSSFYLGGVALVVTDIGSMEQFVSYPHTYPDLTIQEKILELYSKDVGGLQAQNTLIPPEEQSEYDARIQEAIYISAEKLRKSRHRLFGGYALYASGVNYFDALYLAKPYARELKRVYEAMDIQKSESMAHTAVVMSQMLPSYDEVQASPHFIPRVPGVG
jgi:hypothetical protein